MSHESCYTGGGRGGYRDLVTSLEVVLVLAGVPLVILVVLGVVTLRPHWARVRRYEPGQEWNYPPVLWTAHLDAMRGRSFGSVSHPRSGGVRGGASGQW